MITNAGELLKTVNEMGFLPFFKNEVKGFSLEEMTPSEYWFREGVEGPWKWKDIIARSGECIYAKLFNQRAGYFSLEWFPHLANYRRDGYDFDSLADEGFADQRDRAVMQALERNGACLSKELRRICGFTGEKAKGFESCITRLQMMTYILPVSFELMTDRSGKEYGWGVARYVVTEKRFGELARSEYKTDPEESFEKLMARMRELNPKTDEKTLLKLIKRMK